MTQREKGNLPTARTQVRIVADAQRIGLLLHGSDNGAFDLIFAPGLTTTIAKPRRCIASVESWTLSWSDSQRKSFLQPAAADSRSLMLKPYGWAPKPGRMNRELFCPDASSLA
jgi:hypothetical protein